MADNVGVNAGTGTSIATDEIGGAHYQRIKVTWGEDGIAGDASAANPLPVQVNDLPLPDDAATESTLAGIASDLLAGRDYETVAASQTAQALGATGAAGDDIDRLLIIPATTSPGNVLLLDAAISITVFAGGASSVSDLRPFYIPLRIRSISGAWKVTTGADVSVLAIGKFSA